MPTDAREAESIIERVTPRLQHANSAVVLSAVKVMIKYMDLITNQDSLKSLYKKMAPPQKVQLVFVLLAVCGVVPLVLSLGPAVVPTVAVVPLTVLWGLCYAMPFYVPPGEFAMQVGGKSGTGLFTNLFDAAGFAASAMWNPWASAQAKSGDFTSVLYSQAAFGLISMVAMPLCMYRLNAKGAAPKKKALKRLSDTLSGMCIST